MIKIPYFKRWSQTIESMLWAVNIPGHAVTCQDIFCLFEVWIQSHYLLTRYHIKMHWLSILLLQAHGYIGWLKSACAVVINQHQ